MPLHLDRLRRDGEGEQRLCTPRRVRLERRGDLGSLYQHARKDRYANAKPEKGCYTDENTRSCIVSLPEGKVAVINGLKEYIVVDTEDVLLICPRSEEQNIKKFIDEVKYNEGDKHI